MVGKPVTNCESVGTNNSTVTSATGGDFTVEDSWSVDFDLGFDLGPLSIGATANWERSKAQSFSQTITITVSPGEQVRRY